MNEVLCKWVSQDMTTMNNTHWRVGVAQQLPEQDNIDFLKEGIFNYFSDIPFAMMLKEQYGCENYTRLYEVIPEGKIIKREGRCGSTKLTLVKELEVPKVTLDQRTVFAILCALEVYKDPNFINWAEKWLSGEDHSKELKKINFNGGQGYNAPRLDYLSFYNATYAAICKKDLRDDSIMKFTSKAVVQAIQSMPNINIGNIFNRVLNGDY